MTWEGPRARIDKLTYEGDANRFPGADAYGSYRELRQKEVQGVDYRIVTRTGISGIAVLAPHGGNIEPGTSEVASAIASTDHTFYGFEGIKQSGNRKLHITSTRFDEPICMDMLEKSKMVLVIHGCKGDGQKVYIGGLDHQLKRIMAENLVRAGFPIGARPELRGKNLHNLCNGCRTGVGVQLELTFGLRQRMFEDLTHSGRENTTPLFAAFVKAVGQGVSDYARTGLLDHA